MFKIEYRNVGDTIEYIVIESKGEPRDKFKRGVRSTFTLIDSRGNASKYPFSCDFYKRNHHANRFIRQRLVEIERKKEQGRAIGRDVADALKGNLKGAL